jgi:signal transduction histidine kinase
MQVIDDIKNEGMILLDKVKTQLTVQQLVRYIVEGVAVAIAAFVIPNRKTQFNEIALISLIAALTLFVLDLFSSDVGRYTRLGSGFGIGYNLVSNMAVPFL